MDSLLPKHCTVWQFPAGHSFTEQHNEIVTTILHPLPAAMADAVVDGVPAPALTQASGPGVSGVPGETAALKRLINAITALSVVPLGSDLATWRSQVRDNVQHALVSMRSARTFAFERLC